MATIQRTDLNLNNQKRFAEGAVATFPAKLNEGNLRLGTGPEYIDPADDYTAYCLPKQSLVERFYIYTREAFDTGTVATVSTIVDGTVLEATYACDTQGVFTLVTASKVTGALEFGALFDVVDGFSVTFNQTSVNGVLQVMASYMSLDEKSGKYVATV